MIYVIAIPPRGCDWQDKAAARQIVNIGIRDLAERSPGLRAVNVDQSLACEFQQPCENYLQDYLHLAKPGYDILTQELFEIVKDVD
jgi:hypothetical protein